MEMEISSSEFEVQPQRLARTGMHDLEISSSEFEVQPTSKRPLVFLAANDRFPPSLSTPCVTLHRV